MKRIINYFKEHDCYFGFLNVYIFLMILIPKSWSTLFGLIPIRLMFSCVVICGYIIDRYILKNNYHKMNKSLYILFSLFLLFTIPSFWVTKDLIVSLYTFIKFAVTIYVFKIFSTKELKSKQYQILIRSLLIGFSSVVLYGIIQYIFGINLQTVGIVNYAPAKGRVVSNFFNTIYFGLFINLFISFILYFIYNCPQKRKKLLFSVILVFAFSALLLTFSRSSFLVFGGIIFLLVVLNYKLIFNWFAFGSLCLCFVLLLTIPGANRLLTASLEDAYSLFTQVDVLKQFLPNFEEHHELQGEEVSNETIKPEGNKEDEEPNNNPPKKEEELLFEDYSLEHRKDFAVMANTIANDHMFTGVGFGTYIEYMNSDEFAKNYSYYSGDKTHPHSALVLTFAEVGIMALTALILFYINVLVLAIKQLIIDYKSSNKNLAIALFVTIVGFFLVNIMSENAIYDSQIYVIFLMIIGLTFNYLKNKTLKKEK